MKLPDKCLRFISVRKSVADAFHKRCKKEGVFMSAKLEELINQYLDRVEAEHS